MSSAALDLSSLQVSEGEHETLPVGVASRPKVPPAPSLAGTQVGSYRLLGEIGRGGMGVVYRAEHTVIGRAAAVKVLLPEYARLPEVAHRFVDEARAAARIPHPGIVQVYDLCTTPGGLPCIVMEYLEGVNLERYAAGRKLPADEATALLVQLADVLGAAHAQGIAHRDVKPENVLIVPGPGGPLLKLLDFGIARLDLLAPGITVPGTVIGTPWFMAPEQIMGTAISPAVDVYAAGVVLFRLLTGRLPFESDSLLQVLTHHLNTPLPEAEELAGPLGDVVRRAMAKRPEERYPDGHALRDALLDSRRRTPAPVRPPSPAAGPDVTLEGFTLRVRYRSAAALERAQKEELARGRLFLPPGTSIPDGPLSLLVSVGDGAPERFDAEVVFRSNPAAGGIPPGVGLALRSRPRAPHAETPAIEELERLVADLESRNDVDPYGWLGVRPDADMAELKSVLRARSAALDTAWPLAPEALRSRIAAVRLKLDRVRRQMASPESRARYDARVGNFRGVARCIAVGLTGGALEALRRDFARDFPERLCRADKDVAAADALERQDRLPEALVALERALAADPLSPDLQRRYWKLRHGSRVTVP